MNRRDPALDAAAALARQFEELRGSLLGWFTRRMRDRQEAEDLVQESFLRVAQRGNVHELAHLEGYIYRTATSVLTDRARRRAVRMADAHVTLDVVREAANTDDPLRSLLGRRALADVALVLEAMPEQTRTVFILRRIEGLRHKEIALRMGISVSAVEKHMVRAIDLLAVSAEAWQ